MTKTTAAIVPRKGLAAKKRKTKKKNKKTTQKTKHEEYTSIDCS